MPVQHGPTPNLIVIEEKAVQQYMTADLYTDDGMLEVSISDDVIGRVLLDSTSRFTARNALKVMIGRLGETIPLFIDGKES